MEKPYGKTGITYRSFSTLCWSIDFSIRHLINKKTAPPNLGTFGTWGMYICKEMQDYEKKRTQTTTI